MTMLRIGSMNLMLHGITGPNFRCTDTLSEVFAEERGYDGRKSNWYWFATEAKQE
jgi:type I restriction enzyme M protein